MSISIPSNLAPPVALVKALEYFIFYIQNSTPKSWKISYRTIHFLHRFDKDMFLQIILFSMSSRALVMQLLLKINICICSWLYSSKIINLLSLWVPFERMMEINIQNLYSVKMYHTSIDHYWRKSSVYTYISKVIWKCRGRYVSELNFQY